MTEARDEGAPMTSWHLDKKVPLALLFAIAMQTAGAIWWAAAVNSRIGVLEQWKTQTTMVNERLARLEEKVGSVSDDVKDIRQSLRDLTQRPIR